MSRQPTKWHIRTVFGLAALSFALMPAKAGVALADIGDVHHDQITSEEAACRAGLKFGTPPDRIPYECQSHLVRKLNTAIGYKEKWQYREGYLFFQNGILIAIRQMRP
jgi:hypothetical protein